MLFLFYRCLQDAELLLKLTKEVNTTLVNKVSNAVLLLPLGISLVLNEWYRTKPLHNIFQFLAYRIAFFSKVTYFKISANRGL